MDKSVIYLEELSLSQDRDDDMYYQSWGELQYQKTYLYCGWVDSYLTHTFQFERIDGKWYLYRIIADE